MRQNKFGLPAIAGGDPVRKDFLPRAVASMENEDKYAVEKVLDGGNLGQSIKVKEFEEKFAGYVGARYAVAVSSGAAGAHISLMAAALAHEEEVITSPLVHPSTPAAILHQHGMHTFADIDPRTYNVDPEEINKNLSLRTTILMPVHFAGRPCDMDRIQQIAEKNKLDVVEDASHALGAVYKGKKVGTLSDLTIFSFSEPQNVYTGEGGMVVTDSEELYFWLTLFRSGGIVTKPQNFSMKEGPWHFEMQDKGYYYQMSEMQAALGSAQIDKVDYLMQRRKEIAEMYNEAFAKMEQLYVPASFEEGEHSWHYYIIALRPENLKAGRLEIYNALRAENIGVEVHYMPAFMHPYFKWVGHPDVCTIGHSLCPKAEDIYRRFITLPLYPDMTRQDVDDVINAVHKVLGYYTVSSGDSFQ